MSYLPEANAALAILAGVLARITMALLLCYFAARMLPRHAALRHAVLFAGLLCVIAMPLIGDSLLQVEVPGTSFRVPFDQETVTSSAAIESNEERHQTRESGNPPPDIADPAAHQGPSEWVFGLFLGIVAWTMVSGIRTVGLIRSFMKLRDIVRHASVAECRQLQLLVDEFRSRFGFSRDIDVLISPQVSNPMAIGMVQTCIVLPPGLLGSLSSVELKAIMFHEMAHLQRKDHLVVLLQEIVGTLLWWHPLVVLVNRELTRAREEVCDNFVLQSTDAAAYSEALFALSRVLYPSAETTGVTALWGSRWNLERRVSSILDARRILMTSLNLKTSLAVTTLSLAMLFALTTTGFSDGGGDEQQRFEARRDFSDKEMHRIAGMSDLRVVSLADTGVTDAGLKQLAKLTSLENLNLNGTDVTDRGLEHLKALTNLKALALSGTRITSAGLESLAGFKNLTELYLFDTAVTDDGLRHLESLTELTVLNLARTSITDEGLKHLQEMKKLQHLFLGFTRVTDSGLSHLADLKDLRGVFLVRTDVSDRGLEHLSSLNRLETLWLSYTHTTDAGLPQLTDMTRLKHLNLSGTRITDAGLSHVSGLANLETLHVSLTRVGDDGFDHLSGLRKLRSIYAIHTAVNDAAIDRLQQALPNLTVHGPGT